jgi:hypothetical protein
MKTASFIFIALGLCGCATNDLPNYTPYGETRAPKPSNYNPPILTSTEREHTIIGESVFMTPRGMDKISADLKTLAKQHGADAILLSRGAEENRQLQYNVPPSVEYHPQTTYGSGTTTVTSPYGGVVGQANTSGTQTTMVPVAQPGYSGVRNVRVINYVAQFIVFD